MALAYVLCTTLRRGDRLVLPTYFLQVPARMSVCSCVWLSERGGKGGREGGRGSEDGRLCAHVSYARTYVGHISNNGAIHKYI